MLINQNLSPFFFQIVADNKIVISDRVFFGQSTTAGVIELWLSSDRYRLMMPSAKLMAWAITSDSAFIADTVMMKLDMKLPNQVGHRF